MSWGLRVFVPFLLAACVVRSARVLVDASIYPASLSNMHRTLKGLVKDTKSSEGQEKLNAVTAIMEAIDDMVMAESHLKAAARSSECEPNCHEWIKGKEGQLEVLLEKFNSVIETFVSLKEISPQAYDELEPGAREIERNLKGTLKLACDPAEVLEKAVDTAEFNAECQDGLWPAMYLEKSSIPPPRSYKDIGRGWCHGAQKITYHGKPKGGSSFTDEAQCRSKCDECPMCSAFNWSPKRADDNRCILVFSENPKKWAPNGWGYIDTREGFVPAEAATLTVSSWSPHGADAGQCKVKL